MDDIMTGKNEYNVLESFDLRTKRVMNGHEGLTKRDCSPLSIEDPAMGWVIPEITNGKDEMKHPAGRMLDFGCGYGRWYGHLKSLVSFYVGVDTCVARIEYAQKTYADETSRFQIVSLTGFDLGQTFDTILCVNVLQHLTLPDAKIAVQMIAQHLAPTGKAILFEGRIIDGDIEEANRLYHQGNNPEHMIPKPISELQAADKRLKWTRKPNTTVCFTLEHQPVSHGFLDFHTPPVKTGGRFQIPAVDTAKPEIRTPFLATGIDYENPEQKIQVESEQETQEDEKNNS